MPKILETDTSRPTQREHLSELAKMIILKFGQPLLNRISSQLLLKKSYPRESLVLLQDNKSMFSNTAAELARLELKMKLLKDSERK
jgi:hypothetical protein